MPARRSMAFVAVASVVMLVGGCEEQTRGAAPRITLVAPVANTVGVAQVPDGALPSAAFWGLSARMHQATEEAAESGATISVAVLDRATGELVSNGNTDPIAIASVVKLFIADDLLLRDAQGETHLSSQDRAALDLMLRSSDDDAAEIFWGSGGGDEIVTRVAERYKLNSTTPGSDGRWWNAISTAPDLVHYYDKLLDDTGGLPPERANIIVTDLASSTPTGVDGYPQRFGIPNGLPHERVAVKQGWMCCIGNDWMHLFTGVIGPNRRYAMVIESLQPGDEATARATITQAVKTIFPNGLS